MPRQILSFWVLHCLIPEVNCFIIAGILKSKSRLKQVLRVERGNKLRIIVSNIWKLVYDIKVQN